MNSRFYVKINPKFRFKKISLNKQTDFNSYSNIKKILYHFDNKSIIKRYNSEFKQNKDNDNQLARYKSELNQLINSKYVDNLSSISKPFIFLKPSTSFEAFNKSPPPAKGSYATEHFALFINSIT